MDSHNANGAVDFGLANERWLTIYKYCLMAAVAFSVIGLARFLIINADAINSEQVSGSQLVVASAWGVAQTGLFVFALWSTTRAGENWVRTLQLSINGVAVVMVIIRLLMPYSYNVLIQVGNIFVFPIEGVVPWQLVDELQLHRLFRWATSIVSLIFAGYFFFRWLKSAYAAEHKPGPWRKHRIWAGILTVVLGLFLARLWFEFSGQLSFLSGVLSGRSSSGLSIPIPVAAVLLGIVGGGLMFCGERGRGRPMVWLAAVITPLLIISVGVIYEEIVLVVLAISAYLIWVLRNTKPAKESE